MKMPATPMPPETRKPFAPWVWLPLLSGIGALVALVTASLLLPGWQVAEVACLAVFALSAGYFLVQTVARLATRRWRGALFAFLRLTVLAGLLIPTMGLLLISSFFGPSEDGFADHLTIPEGIEIAEPESDAAGEWSEADSKGTDTMQLAVKAALLAPGGSDPSFAPSMPSLRRASTDHPADFRAYIEASPDWHVFIEQGNHFAARRWSYGGEPRDELHGYISGFGGEASFQTRVLLCLDRKQWSRYDVQHVQEGSSPVTPEMSEGNRMHESRVMIECGGVWVEVFEQSESLERRVTKATVATLEAEFSEFIKDPPATVSRAKARARDLALRLGGASGEPFRLLEGMQPGIYGVAFSLNPGEAGAVYLKAFEITQGTPLSEDRLEAASETRMTWSAEPAEKFGAKSGFTIYEGDWGKPYAARFEVWFKPDSKGPERKLAERIYKIEGWQR
jgi:hypothetical protein